MMHEDSFDWLADMPSPEFSARLKTGKMKIIN